MSVPIPILESDLLPPVAEIIGAFAAIADELEQETDAVTMEQITVTLPVEFEFWRHGEDLELRTSPPTQKVSTTVLPVWHRLSMTVTLEENADAGSSS